LKYPDTSSVFNCFSSFHTTYSKSYFYIIFTMLKKPKTTSRNMVEEEKKLGSENITYISETLGTIFPNKEIPSKYRDLFRWYQLKFILDEEYLPCEKIPKLCELYEKLKITEEKRSKLKMDKGLVKLLDSLEQESLLLICKSKEIQKK